MSETVAQAGTLAASDAPAEVARVSGELAVRNALVSAIDACVMTRHQFAHLLGEDRPPYSAGVEVGLAHYGLGDRYVIWCWWRAAERLRLAADAWELAVGQAGTQGSLFGKPAEAG